MWRHRFAGGLNKLYLRSDSQRHRHFAGFFNVPVLHRHGTTLFIRWFRHTAPLVTFYDTLGIRRTYSRLKPRRPHGVKLYTCRRYWITYSLVLENFKNIVYIQLYCGTSSRFCFVWENGWYLSLIFPISWTSDRGTGHPQSGSCIVSGMVKGSTASSSHPPRPLGFKPSPKH